MVIIINLIATFLFIFVLFDLYIFALIFLQIKYISCYGNNLDETKAIMNVMKKLMYHCLAKNINFKGIDPNSAKIPLEQCHLWNMIQDKLLHVLSLYNLTIIFYMYNIVTSLC